MSNNTVVRRRVVVTFDKEGIHCYPAAGTEPNLADVSFLQYPHRHIFKFRVEVSVTHDDRDIEFIQLKRKCLNFFDNGVIDVNSKSCEMLCDDLYNKLIEVYPGRDFKICCYEDGENGAEVEYLIQ